MAGSAREALLALRAGDTARFAAGWNMLVAADRDALGLFGQHLVAAVHPDGRGDLASALARGQLAKAGFPRLAAALRHRERAAYERGKAAAIAKLRGGSRWCRLLEVVRHIGGWLHGLLKLLPR